MKTYGLQIENTSRAATTFSSRCLLFSLPTYPPSDDGPVDYRAETVSPASPPGGAVMGSQVQMDITYPYKKLN